MGAGNVKAAYALWGALPDPAFRLLAFMALISRDDASPPSCWAGRDTLALGIGRTPPHTDADFRALSRAMRQLREAGAIELELHSAPGRTARYELRLRPATGDATRPLNTGRAATGTGDAPRPEQVTRGDQTHDASRRPEEKQEEGGLTGGATEHLPASSEQGRSRHSYMDDEYGMSCETCGLPAGHSVHGWSA